MESGYEKLLKGISGSKLVVRDGQRRIIEDIENINEPVSGKTLELSIDSAHSISGVSRVCSWRSDAQ